MKEKQKEKLSRLREMAKIQLHLISRLHALKRDYYKRLAEFDAEIIVLMKARQEMVLERFTADEKLAEHTASLARTKAKMKKLKDDDTTVEDAKKRILRLRKQIKILEATLQDK